VLIGSCLPNAQRHHEDPLFIYDVPEVLLESSAKCTTLSNASVFR